MTNRLTLLQTAAELTGNARNKTYGEPVANMQHIADIFNAWTGRNLSAQEIAQVHTATKLARTQTSPTHEDSYVDSMAYRGIEFECAKAAMTKTKVEVRTTTPLGAFYDGRTLASKLTPE